jgi:hypothetical protein
LPCGPTAPDEVPALVLVEKTQWTGAEEPEYVEYWYAPYLARIRYPRGEVVLDLVRGRVAFFDAKAESWNVESLESWEAYVDSLADVARARMVPSEPEWVPSPTPRSGLPHIVKHACTPYQLTATMEYGDDTRERIEQQIWVTRDIAASEEIYETYRLALYLLDRQWLDVPVERPAGIILRSRATHRTTEPGLTEERIEVEDAVVVKQSYQLLPRTFFDIPLDEVALPGNVRAGEAR